MEHGLTFNNLASSQHNAYLKQRNPQIIANNKMEGQWTATIPRLCRWMNDSLCYVGTLYKMHLHFEADADCETLRNIASLGARAFRFSTTHSRIRYASLSVLAKVG